MQNYFIIFNPSEHQHELIMLPFSDELSALQSCVNGHIEHLLFEELSEHYIDCWINEDGKHLKLKPSLVFYHDGKLLDLVVGPLVFTRYDDYGETYGLTDIDLRIIAEWLNDKRCMQYTDRDNGKSWIIPVVDV